MPRLDDIVRPDQLLGRGRAQLTTEAWVYGFLGEPGQIECQSFQVQPQAAYKLRCFYMAGDLQNVALASLMVGNEEQLFTAGESVVPVLFAFDGVASPPSFLAELPRGSVMQRVDSLRWGCPSAFAPALFVSAGDVGTRIAIAWVGRVDSLLLGLEQIK